MRLELIPRGWFHRKVEVDLGSGRTVAVERNWCGTRADFRFDGVGFRMVAAGWARNRYRLESGTRVLAEAAPTRAFGSRYRVRLHPGGTGGGDQPEASSAWSELTLRRAGWLSGAHDLLAGERPLGRARRRGVFRGGLTLELLDGLSTPLALFCGLVLLAIRDSEASAVAGA